jgi:hypothetical protein
MNEYIIVDVETVPLDYKEYKAVPEEERNKFFNPICSKIVAIGIRRNSQNVLHVSLDDERSILDAFWDTWHTLDANRCPIVGFNIVEFDIVMLVGRSFVNNVEVVPFTQRELIDLRLKLAAYKWNAKGTLKEYAKLIGLELSEFDGSMVADLVAAGRIDDLKGYLERDLELTDEIFKRAERLNIIKIERW